MPETVPVDTAVEEVCCDGGRTFGHPRIYMTLDDNGCSECYYCGCRFQRTAAGPGASRNDAA